MSQPQQSLWFTYKNGTQEAYWSKFKGEGEFAMLVTDFKGSGDGYQPQNLGPFTKDGFSYTASTKTSKKTGKPYWVIQRRKQTGDPIIDGLKDEEQIAHQTLPQVATSLEPGKLYPKPSGMFNDVERQARIEKAHQENLTAQQNINETLIAILGELRRIADAQEAKHEI